MAVTEDGRALQQVMGKEQITIDAAITRHPVEPGTLNLADSKSSP